MLLIINRIALILTKKMIFRFFHKAEIAKAELLAVED